MKSNLSRRRFAQLLGSAGVGGTALLDALVAEVQDPGTLSDASVRAFLEFAGVQLAEDQIPKVKQSLERSVRNIKKIREFEIPQEIEPATVLRVRR